MKHRNYNRTYPTYNVTHRRMRCKYRNKHSNHLTEGNYDNTSAYKPTQCFECAFTVLELVERYVDTKTVMK